MNFNERMNTAKELANIIEAGFNKDTGQIAEDTREAASTLFGTVPAAARGEVYVLMRGKLHDRGIDFDNQVAA